MDSVRLSRAVTKYGILAMLLLLSSIDARAQSVERTVWTCADVARAGQPVGVDGNCSIAQQRWDVGGLTTQLYAQCSLTTCTNSTDYQNAVWRRWADLPANAWLFGCPGPRAPGPWGNCAGERFYPRDQIAGSTPPDPPPPPPVRKTRPPVGLAADVPIGIVRHALLSWQKVTQYEDGESIPSSQPVGYYLHDCEAVENCAQPALIGSTTDSDHLGVDLAPGMHWFHITAALAGGPMSERSASVPKSIADIPVMVFTANPNPLPRHGNVTLEWQATNMLGCARSWVPTISDGPTTPFIGSEQIAVHEDTRFQLTCTGLNGAIYDGDLTVRVTSDWRPPVLDCLPFDVTKISPGRLISGVVAGEAFSILSGLGLQELHAGRRSAYGWTCDLADRNVPEWFVLDRDTFSYDCARAVEGNMLSEGYWREVWNACTKPLSEGDMQLGKTLEALYRPTFAVSPIAAGTRPVHLRKDDGARGARVTVNGVAQSIAVGSECNGRRRLTGTTTRYHEVSGQLSATGQTLPANSFTVCRITLAPATGWPAP